MTASAATSEVIAASELAARVRRHGLRLRDGELHRWLLQWEREGIVERVDGRWRLTESARAQFGDALSLLDTSA